MKFPRLFTNANCPVVDQIAWRLTDVKSGSFEMKGVEVPAQWSYKAANIFAAKYLRKAGVPSTTMNSARNYKEGKMPLWLCPQIAKEGATFGPETSTKQVFHRLCGHWTYMGWKAGYFKGDPNLDSQGKGYDNETSAQAFYDELFYMLANQFAAANSPQWFNTGLWWAYGIEGPASGQWAVELSSGRQSDDDSFDQFLPGGFGLFEMANAYERPQPHACFIQPVSDDLVNPGGIMDLVVREARLFKQGSGTGTNFSTLRGKNEKLSGGGISSGLMSFLRIGDRSADAIQSGGTTRRAAKMVIVDANHPEIEDFIDWKVREESKAAALYVGSQYIRDAVLNEYEDRLLPDAVRERSQAGFEPEIFDIDFMGEAYSTISGQNSNNSVRVTDDFMKRVEYRDGWDLTNRLDGSVSKLVLAGHLWTQISRAAWACADPGLQFHDTINRWHTCKADGEIRASNPCCFVGETLVDTSEGKIRFDDLERMYRKGEKLPFSFGFSMSDRMPTLSQIRRVWIAGETNDLVRIVTDKGIEFFCTPEHRILIRHGKIEAGTWIQAKDLNPGMRLRKIGRLINSLRGNRCTISTRKGDFYQNRFIWEQIYGLIPNGYDVHHKDENPANDKLSNFELKEITEHKSLHFGGNKNPKWLEVDSTKLIEAYEEIEKFISTRANGHNGAHYTNWNAYVKRNNLVGIIPLANSATGRIRGMEWPEFSNWIEENRGQVNHRIVSVEKIKLDTPIKVYDLEVSSEDHNFGVTSYIDTGGDSIIVHNSEYMFLDNTACNLASLNLGAFLDYDSRVPTTTGLNTQRFEHATRLWMVVLDISNEMASFPSREIALGTYNYRTTGLGFANLGGMLMRLGLAYDSDEGRAWASGITALMHGICGLTSAEMASELGAFPRFEANKDSMLKVIQQHIKAMEETIFPHFIMGKIDEICKRLSQAKSFRNAQWTLIAPTGTISFVMGCDDFTGVEPAFSLRTSKSLVGGGSIESTNTAVSEALTKLGYPSHKRNLILAYIDSHGTVENCPDLEEKDLAIFDCATPPEGFSRHLRPEAHLLMMAAVQPFLSGAISKTVNMPQTATIEDVSRIYKMAHTLGLKSVAIYRDKSKLSQPLQAQKREEPKTVGEYIENISRALESPIQHFPRAMTREEILTDNKSIGLQRGEREYLPWMRTGGFTQKVHLGDFQLFLTANPFPDGRLGEFYMEFAGQGSVMRAMGNLVSILGSLALQYGMPAEKLVEALRGLKFEPAGVIEGDDKIRLVSSVADYVGRKLGSHFLGRDDLLDVRELKIVGSEDQIVALDKRAMGITHGYSGDICSKCGSIKMFRNGTCLMCDECGSTTGCGG